MSHDTWLVILTNAGTFIAASLFWIAYGTFKADAMRQQNQAEQDVLRKENRALSDMMVVQDKQYRVLKHVPVAKLIGDGAGSGDTG